MNISFIIPCYQKFKLFTAACPLNAAFREDDVEIILALDEPSEARDFIDWAKRHHGYKIRILVHRSSHDWRPPCRAINAGVRHAEGQFIAIMSPETIVAIPAPRYLQHRLRTGTLLMGTLWNVSNWNESMNQYDLWHRIHHIEITNSPNGFGVGFVAVEKTAFENICGMNELQNHWGSDDGALRMRLIRYGMTGAIDPMIKVFHIWHDAGVDRVTPPPSAIPPSVVYSHQPNWGRNSDFHIAFDWRNG